MDDTPDTPDAPDAPDAPNSRARRWIGSIGSVLPDARLASTAKRLFRDYSRQVYGPLAGTLRTYPSPLVLDRAGLQATCRRRGMLTYYGTSEVFCLTVPDAADGPVARLERCAGEHLLPTPFVGELPEVTLMGRYPIPLRDRRVVLEAIGREEVAVLNVYYSLTEGGPVRRTKRTRTIDRAVLLHNCWTHGYFHWVTEALTRLEGLEHYHERTGRRPPLIVGPNPSSFQTESLELLGYSEDDWIEWDGTTTTVDRLVVPSIRRGTNRGSETGPVAYEWLRDRLRAAVDRGDADRFSRRIYVSRADADRRRVVNEGEVIDLLSDYGFEAYRLADMSVAENVALFSEAECVVAPHGAGLTNLLFAEDASVVEFIRPNDSSTYCILTQHAGHRHRYLDCEPMGVDFRVDLDALDAAVTATLTSA